MEKRRLVSVIVLIVMGLLQLWDSRAFTAGSTVIALVLAALALPVGSLLFTDRMEVRIAAVLACAALLLSTKLLAPHPLPAIGVIAAIAMAANWLAAAKRA
ncbi:MAG TPA: hypothetical protein VFT24_09745 [Vicinamibacterales bacterium]|nr:hypothetical protein [Vicinamibacterales bacterium]